MSQKFDVVIGNPPYQEEARGEGTRETPLYHLFMDAAYEIGKKAVLITPARFLFSAGFTPKAWNEKMLSDPRLVVSHYEPKSQEVFPGPDIKGGIAVTSWDQDREGDPIGTFTKYPELNTILQKVIESKAVPIERIGISTSRSYRYSDKLYEDHPELLSLRPSGNKYLISTNAFEQFDKIFSTEAPSEAGRHCQILGLDGRARDYRWISADYIAGPESFRSFKVVLTAANGSGVLGEPLSSPLIVGPDVAVTQTFITVGAFEDEDSAVACLKYVKSKFARVLLGVLKITQHNPAKVWKYVPLQDFTSSSDIDWTALDGEIDQQLYSKYGLDAAEIEFIETEVRSMA